MPALKLSQPQGSFYAIPRKDAVEKIESQGCLPQRAFMQTQVIDTAATDESAHSERSPSIAADTTVLSSHWQCLPLQQLMNFEVIDHQFALQQVWFESAIALRPSNPSFQADEASLALMAHSHRPGLKITLGNTIHEVDFGFIASEPLTVSCLDPQGHCTAMVRVMQEAPQQQTDNCQPEKYLLQGIGINTRGAKTLRIDSHAPFVLTRFWVKHTAA